MSTADIRVYTAPTMNGWKPLIFLEEAGVDYELVRIDFSRSEQRAPWYLELNPDGRIPTTVDHEEFSIRRFTHESRRLLQVLDHGLARHSYVAGDEFTIADMAH